MQVRDRTAFTLVEVLIVVVILGILAAIVLPQFADASGDAQEASLVQDLNTMRSQIELFKLHHDGVYPAAGGTAQDFRDQMCLPTDKAATVGTLGDPAFPYGPYLVKDPPANPYNGGRAVKIVADMTAVIPAEAMTVVIGPDTVKVGWFFNPDTGELMANCEGNAADGTPLKDL